jgi:uncharacterized protein
LPYAQHTPAQARQAHARNHEIIVHLPMEPQPHPGISLPGLGPHGLTVSMSSSSLHTALINNLQPLLPIAVGANNHMGSRFTAWPEGMRLVLTTLQQEGLLFLDSRTAAPTATRQAAQGLSLPLLSRDVFLDHIPTEEAIHQELSRAVALATRRGQAIAIGHPLSSTLNVLEQRLPELISSTSIQLVPLTALVPGS